MLNASLAAVFVFIGSFRGLLTFKGKFVIIVSNFDSVERWLILNCFQLGMMEYLVYLMTVSGLLKLRLSHNLVHTEPQSERYYTSHVNPWIFCCVSGLIAIQSAFSHLVQATIIIILFASGVLLYRSSWWQRLVTPV